ncbi:MAG: YdbH domain-containing protein [Gammaproteobacteria bacterium]|nr:YdbH domain-containing protein [Gammaproteobacteria bacterium]
MPLAVVALSRRLLARLTVCVLIGITYAGAATQTQVQRFASPAPPKSDNRADRFPSIQIRTGEISLPELGLGAAAVNAAITLGTDGIHGRYTIDGLRDLAWPAAVAALTIDGTLHSSPARVEAAGRALVEGQPVARWRLNPPNARTYPSVEVDIDAPATTLWRQLKPLMGESFAPFDIDDGSVGGRMLLSWAADDPINGTGRITASGVVGTYDEVRFADAKIVAHITDIIRPSLEYQVDVVTTRLANGLEIENFHTQVNHQGEILSYLESSMRALGGIIRLPAATLDVNRYPFTTVLSIDEVDLASLLALLEQEGLSGSGSLTGSIPLAFHADYFVIEKAELHSTTQGNLRYTPSEGKVSERIDNIALTALKDFRYQVMNMELDYDREGNYGIKTRLEGHNPDLYDGHPIAFNLNITGTLPGLLRSSLLSGDFSNQVLKSINKNP